MHSFVEMILQGNRFGAPTMEAEEIDAEVATRGEQAHCSWPDPPV